MTVAELIAELQKMTPTDIVIVQADAEGNGYSPLEGVDGSSVYVAENTWSGQTYQREPEDPEDDDMSDEDRAAMVPCVVLFPVN